MVTITKLRENIYQLINEVIETGKPLIIRRKDGKEVKIMVEEPMNQLEKLFSMPVSLKTPPELTDEELIYHDMGLPSEERWDELYNDRDEE